MKPEQIKVGRTYRGEEDNFFRKVYGIYSPGRKMLVGFDLLTIGLEVLGHSCMTIEDFAAWAIEGVT